MEGTPTAPGAERRGITVGPPVADGWRVVDDRGRALVLPAGAVDATLRSLRVGQRLVAEVRDGVIVAARLP